MGDKMAAYSVTVRKGRQWNEYIVFAKSAADARAEARRVAPGYTIVRVQRDEDVSAYQPLFA